MPTILRYQSYRFYFYSHQPDEPPHIHVDWDDKSAKFWLSPVALARNFGYNAKELNELLRIVLDRQSVLWRHGVSILNHKADIFIAAVRVDAERLSVDLKDGRTLSVPLAWYPRLFKATAAQRQNWQIAGGGHGIHWPEIDEDLSAEGLLSGAAAPHALIDAE